MPVNEDGDPRIRPHLHYRDTAAAVMWLVRVFGFTEQMRFDRSDGDFTARLEGPDGGTVMVSGLGEEFKAWMRERAPRFEEGSEPGWPLLTHAVTVVVDRVDAHYRRAEGEGASILSPPTDQPWGVRSYAALDPEGHQWEFAAPADSANPGDALAPRAVPIPLTAVPEATPLGVQAQLSVRCGRKAVEFYQKAFGAEPVFLFGGDAQYEEIVAQLAVGVTRFWVEDESPEHHNFSPESLGGASERMLLVVEDPVAVMQRAIAAGAKEVYAVEEAHGWLLGRVADPFGHHWEIGKPLSTWPPATPEGTGR